MGIFEIYYLFVPIQVQLHFFIDRVITFVNGNGSYTAF